MILRVFIHINKDGTIKVEERIRYDFGYVRKHGIYRTIPTIKKNNEGKKYELDYDILSVTDENSIPYRYSVSRGETLSIKIGDANRYVTGEKTYIISYLVSGALTYFSDHDELYWNVTGNGWDVPINTSSVEISLPENISSDKLKVACYTGAAGSTEQNCTATANGVVTGTTSVPLYAKSGFTFVVSFPKQIVAVLEPKLYVPFWETTWGRNVSFILGVFAFIWYIGLTLAIPLIWFVFGRDPKADGPVRAWFDPPKTKSGRFLNPCETGSLIDEKPTQRMYLLPLLIWRVEDFLKLSKRKRRFLFYPHWRK
jgi:hypothetical protein